MNYGARQATVMIAEHDRAVLELIQIRLSVAGYGTCMARTGVLAMQSLEGLRPDALVIDRDLPELNGFEVLETLRGHGVRPTYPILFLMKAPSREDIQRAVGLGARDVMTKPFSGAEIVERVERMLRAPAPPPRRAAAG
ncbi:MAG: response regulator transcription factor [Phenylobacterium sp.]|uniref:response regulator transcription factor n=1 Tax=Phenylobacterium sp. TaxID=1871053 RepID=UPI003919E2D6